MLKPSQLPVLVAVIGFFVSIDGRAQLRTDKAAIQWGESFERSSYAIDRGFIGKTDDRAYNLSIQSGRDGRSHGFLLRAIDADLNIEASSFFNADSIANEESLEALIHLGGKLYLLTTIADELQHESILCAREIQNESLRLSSIVDTLLRWPTALYKSDLSGAEFQLSQSQNGDWLVLYKEHASSQVESPRYSVAVLDADLKVAWQRTCALPFANNRLEFEKMRLLDNGTLVWFARLNEPPAMAERAVGRDVVLGVADESTFQTLILRAGLYPIACLEAFSFEDELRLVGYYGESRFLSLRGWYYGRFERSTLKLIEERFMAFETPLVVKSIKPRKHDRFYKKFEKGRSEELRFYKIKLPVVRDDGSVLLMAEQSYVSHTASRDANGAEKATYYYHFQDVLIHQFDASGRLKWEQKIPKHQMSKNDNGNFSSFAFVWVESRVVLVYYDHPLNLYYRSGPPAVLRSMKSEPLLMFAEVIDGRTVKREPLLGDSHSDFHLRPGAAFHWSEDALLLSGEQDRLGVYARMQLLK